MAGVVHGMDSALKSMNLEKVIVCKAVSVKPRMDKSTVFPLFLRL